MKCVLHNTCLLFLAVLCAECILSQNTKVETSKQKTANYVARQLVKEEKGKELFDDLQDMLAGLMLAGTLPESTELEEEKEGAGSNDDKATRRTRRNRRERERQRRNRRNSNSDPRRIRVRYRTRRNADEIA